ncbi:hypothetical protein BC940DRAFT_311664 [Gongronella butleri]|nr:hypothetical protein BC940DRAFT_311664 [Gongronella butleri]
MATQRTQIDDNSSTPPCTIVRTSSTSVLVRPQGKSFGRMAKHTQPLHQQPSTGKDDAAQSKSGLRRRSLPTTLGATTARLATSPLAITLPNAININMSAPMTARHTTETPVIENATPTTPDAVSNTFYDCNICFDIALYPVLTVCGHLFCWVCLCRWLEQQQTNPTCPMCKAGCCKDKVIPIYGRGREEVDPRCDASVPVRPAGQRPTPLHNPNIVGSSLLQSFRSPSTLQATRANTRTNDDDGHTHTGFFSRLMLMILSLFIVIVVFY